jgi:hypothetical protein
VTVDPVERRAEAIRGLLEQPGDAKSALVREALERLSRTSAA